MSILRKPYNIIAVVVLIAVLGLAVIYRQDIIDEIDFRRYQPTAEISNIAQRSGMSETGKRLFYLSDPQLKSANEFNGDCRREEKVSAILGCYDEEKGSIYIYNVKNAELDGIKEVTAAHEMLHAAWARLSENDKSRLTPLLEQAYQKNKNEKFAERMGYYDRAQPGSRVNELHSILGTEFADIGDELEQHYARYFSNRNAVVSLHKNYQQKFDNIEQEAEALRNDLMARKMAISSDINSYTSDLTSYNQLVSSFNKRAASGDFSSQESFQRERTKLQQQLADLRQRRESLNRRVDDYNADAKRLQQLGVKMEELQNSLDSVKEAE